MDKFIKHDKCGYPDCKKDGIHRRQNTQYVDDESNFATLCEEHHEENDQYWNEMWADYYSGVL